MSNNILTYNDRLNLEKFIHENKTYREMGVFLDINHSTLWREINRNGGRRNYDPYQADVKSFFARQASDIQGKQIKLLDDSITQDRIQSYLKKNLAPQVMVGRAKKERSPLPVSHQTIYQFIYHHRPEWICYLPYRKKKKYRLKKSIKKQVYPLKTNIKYRCELANQRKSYGHYELDTIHLDKGGILTVVDRKSRLLVASILENLKTSTTTVALSQIITSLGARFGKVKSLTSDNGSEFWGHKELKNRFSIPYFHCDSYSSWQRGTNENTNRILRRYFPKKGNSYQNISQSNLNQVVKMINSTPRKILNYLTPYEAHSKTFAPILL